MSNASFTKSRLMGGRVVVKGTDINGAVGETVLNSHEWDEINSRTDFSKASKDFDDAVEKFFSPLTKAADALAHSQAGVPQDSLSYVVLQEEVKATAGQPGVIVELSKDSIILRLLEQGDFERLVWVGDSLEVTEATAPSPVSNVVGDDNFVTGGTDFVLPEDGRGSE